MSKKNSFESIKKEQNRRGAYPYSLSLIDIFSSIFCLFVFFISFNSFVGHFKEIQLSKNYLNYFSIFLMLLLSAMIFLRFVAHCLKRRGVVFPLRPKQKQTIENPSKSKVFMVGYFFVMAVLLTCLSAVYSLFLPFIYDLVLELDLLSVVFIFLALVSGFLFLAALFSVGDYAYERKRWFSVLQQFFINQGKEHRSE